MNRIKNLMTTLIAIAENASALTVCFGEARLAEIVSGTVKLSLNEAEQIARLPGSLISPKLILQMNADDLSSTAQKKESPKRTQTSKSPSVSMRGNAPPRRDW